jgi:predicted TIM-barrel enzyme
MPSAGSSVTVSKINTGAAIVISGRDGGYNRYGEKYFSIVKSVSGVPTLISRGVLPATVTSPFYVHPQSGVAIYTIITGNASSNSTSSHQFKKMAITGAI